MSDALLQDLMCQLMEPALLVDSSRNIIFATKSFHQLIGDQVLDRHCSHLLIPSVNDEGADLCCWDGLDRYLRLKSNGLWLVKRPNGGYMPALCMPSPVDIAGTHSYIHIHVRPLSPPAGAIMLLFHSIRKKFGDVGQFRSWVVGYLHNTWGVRSEWIDLDGRTENHCNGISLGLKKTNWAGPFDIVLQQGKRPFIQSIFPTRRGESSSVLALKRTKGILDEDLVMSAWAAVRAANWRESAFPVEVPESLKLSPLSLREGEVLAFVAKGMSDGEIATRLRVSVHTVKNHVRHIMCKCGIHKRVKLATLFQQSQ